MESGVRLLLLLSTLLFPLAVSDLIQVDATSDAPLLELPPFGLGPNGRIRADIIIGDKDGSSTKILASYYENFFVYFSIYSITVVHAEEAIPVSIGNYRIVFLL